MLNPSAVLIEWVVREARSPVLVVGRFMIPGKNTKLPFLCMSVMLTILLRQWRIVLRSLRYISYPRVQEFGAMGVCHDS